MARQVFNETDDYKLEIQMIEHQFHVHCLVYNWKPSVLKELYRQVVKVGQYAFSLGYTEVYSVSPNPKFCKLLGAYSVGQYRDDYEVMKWDLK